MCQAWYDNRAYARGATDSAFDSGSKGCRFDPCRACQINVEDQWSFFFRFCDPNKVVFSDDLRKS